MEWLKKKKEEAKQAAAKLQNKRTAFKGEGNVLGGDGVAAKGDAAPPPASGNGKTGSFKVPFTKPAPPPLSEEEKARRREIQTKAAEARTSAWDKRVNTARKARLANEGEEENKFDLPPVPPRSSSSSPTSRSINAGPVLSNDEVKRRELEAARSQLGFNPYAATFASSTEVGAATNAIGGTAPPPPPVSLPRPALVRATSALGDANGAVYVLLRQDSQRAIPAAETIIKILNNTLQNPQEEKFRRVRLSNASIEAKLVSVPGAVDLLREAGFSDMEIDGEKLLILDADQFDPDRVTSVVDRTDVALMQLKVDSGGLV